MQQSTQSAKNTVIKRVRRRSCGHFIRVIDFSRQRTTTAGQQKNETEDGLDAV